MDPGAPADRRRVLVFVCQEARAADHVHGLLVHRRDQPLELDRVVLAVAVDLREEVIAVLARVHEAGLHGAADTQVERQLEDLRAGFEREHCRGVGRAVVDHQRVEAGRALPQRFHDRHDRLRLVVSGDDRQMRYQRPSYSSWAPAITAVVASPTPDPAATRLYARAAALESLLEQSLSPTEMLVIDNDPRGATASALADASLAAGVRVLNPSSNLGYTGAANLAAREASGEWLFFLNPDAVAASDCLERLLEAVDGPDVGVVGAQVLLPDGRINAGDNPVNILGISWSGGYGRAAGARALP